MLGRAFGDSYVMLSGVMPALHADDVGQKLMCSGPSAGDWELREGWGRGRTHVLSSSTDRLVTATPMQCRSSLSGVDVAASVMNGMSARMSAEQVLAIIIT
jgi:hypothetical protein